ncbi:hypothetical protein E2542_SST06698 [Spatholobus suberectus]|nr:hypothetical protein E2542_SST06698 [Spatholobus suberectus]
MPVSIEPGSASPALVLVCLPRAIAALSPSVCEASSIRPAVGAASPSRRWGSPLGYGPGPVLHSFITKKEAASFVHWQCGLQVAQGSHVVGSLAVVDGLGLGGIAALDGPKLIPKWAMFGER